MTDFSSDSVEPPGKLYVCEQKSNPHRKVDMKNINVWTNSSVGGGRIV